MNKLFDIPELFFHHVPEADLFQILLLSQGERYKHHIFENYTDIDFFMEPNAKKFKFSDISEWNHFDCLDFQILTQKEAMAYPFKSLVEYFISSDYLIYLCLDTFEIPFYETYQQEHAVHDCILCGINQGQLLCYDYYDFLKPEFQYISFEDLYKGFSNMQSVTYTPINERFRRPEFAALKLKENYDRAPDIGKIKNDLQKGPHRKLDYLLIHIENVIEQREELYLKHFNFLYSYLKVTSEKMKFYGWENKVYYDLVDRAYILLFKALKYSVKMKFDKDKLIEVYDLAKDVLQRFYMEIEHTIDQIIQ